MKLAFVDCSISGVSGDMLTASLVDAGAPAGKVKKAMLAAGKPFGGVRVDIRRVRVSEIEATRVEVETNDWGGRTYGKIVEQLRELPMPKEVKSAVLKTIKILGEGEARAHGRRLEQLVLHEVGAADAIADIVGCCAAAHELGLFGGEILASEVAVGKGTVGFTHHGRTPLPAPATIEILKGRPIRGVDSDVELTTPTGAALLVALADGFVTTCPLMHVEKIGYGAGSRELPTPNVVRVCVGETSKRGLEIQEIAVLETNVDDVSGEVLGYTIEKLLARGALDASATPALMKKGRLGFLIKVLTKPKDAERLARVLMLETGTLGVRVQPSVHRYTLGREIERVELGLGGRKFKARVKVARAGGKLFGLTAEYEDAKLIAEKTGMPLREVMRLIEGAARRKMSASKKQES